MGAIHVQIYEYMSHIYIFKSITRLGLKEYSFLIFKILNNIYLKYV